MSYINQFLLKNKIILLTGATGILGKNFTEALFKSGASVVIADLSLKNCQDLKNKIDGKSENLLPCELDITNKTSVNNCLDLIIKKFGKIDGLVNNAVLRAPASEDFFSRDFEVFKKTTNVNVNGVFLVSKEVSKIMKEQKTGTIVNIGSIYGMLGNNQLLYGNKTANYDYYCFHKGGILNFTRYLAVLLGRYNIRVNSLSPGGILWGQEQEFVDNYSKRTPLGRMANPDEMNGPLIFLLSDAANYVTGHNLVVDGGWTAW